MGAALETGIRVLNPVSAIASGLEHLSQQQAIHAFLAINQMRLKCRPLRRWKRAVQVALYHRVPVDLAMVRHYTADYLTAGSECGKVKLVNPNRSIPDGEGV